MPSVGRQISAAVLFAVVAASARANTVYVDDDASMGGDGTSWSTAFARLQDGLAVAAPGDEIHIAGGIYKPDQDEAGNVVPGDREVSFQLISGVGLYGGYAGVGAPDPNVRDIALYDTVLSGDLNGDDGPDFVNNGDNSYSVVDSSGTDTTAVMDGLTITSGNADWLYWRDAGGGMYNDSGSPTLTNCTFSENSASSGGGMYNRSSSPTLASCTFRENAAG